jgi:2-polyprenyl-3-methyl-5-hydroxy-6-metoxy-1,4-benzoquinol methylase
VNRIYEEDLAYIQAKEFGGLAEGAASEIIRRLRRAAVPVKRVVDAGCGAGPLSKALVEAGFEVTGIDLNSIQVQPMWLSSICWRPRIAISGTLP